MKSFLYISIFCTFLISSTFAETKNLVIDNKLQSITESIPLAEGLNPSESYNWTYGSEVFEHTTKSFGLSVAQAKLRVVYYYDGVFPNQDGSFARFSVVPEYVSVIPGAKISISYSDNSGLSFPTELPIVRVYNINVKIKVEWIGPFAKNSAGIIKTITLFSDGRIKEM